MKEILNLKATDGYIDDNRVHLPFSYSVKCPNCGNMMIDDLMENSINNPELGQSHKRFFCCDKCENEYSLDIELKSLSIEIEFDSNNLIKQ